MEMPGESTIAHGLIDRIGAGVGTLLYKNKKETIRKEEEIKTHQTGLELVAELLLDPEKGSLGSPEEVYAIGHRVVHGGNLYSKTTVITEEVKATIERLSALAPLHNPHNLAGIKVAEHIFPKAKQIAVFDTAFHQTIPVRAKKYAIPNELFEDKSIQLYGFHGTSHKYVTEKVNAWYGKKLDKVISIHLGNGCSITAVKNGRSVDHSLGFAPSNGLVMGTRSGDIDHSIIFHLVRNLDYTLEEVENMLNKRSGMVGLTGYTDLRDIQKAAEENDSACQLALEMNVYRIKKYIGSYCAVLNGLDAIIFTAGIGENSSLIREMVCKEMSFYGIEIDIQKNKAKNNGLREIHAENSSVKILVVPTDEEAEIAKQTYTLLT